MYSILIVEEDVETSEALEKCLAEEYEVHRATNSVTAITNLKRKRIDLILMALNLSGVDGMKFTHRLRTNRGYKNIPIILIAEKVDNKIVELGLQHGANDFIIKPIDPAALISKVRNQLGLSKTEGVNLRQSERYKVQRRLDYQQLSPEEMLTPPEGYQTSILNISEGGIAFSPQSEISAGNICAFSIYLEGQERPFLAVGQIVWVKPMKGRKVAGAKWLGWESGKEQELIMKAIQAEKEPEDQTNQAETGTITEDS
ncbi:MAG: response regulator [Candidatus Poribacteria bacterium]|nr:response regulator [Candidatus Poribacteria bacterium]